VTGCTSANITGKVGATTTHYFDLNDSGGSAVICNAAGTNYNWNIMNDSGYGVRFYVPWLAMGYDWFSGEFTSGQKTQIFNTINAFLDEIKAGYTLSGSGWRYDGQTQSNYHTGYVFGLAMAGICTRGSGENARGEEWYDYWRDTMYESYDKPFFSRWLGNDGGFDEAFQYNQLQVQSYAIVAMSQYTANSEALWGSAEWPWLLGNMRYWIHNTMPPMTYFSGRGIVNTGDTTPNRWRSTAMMALHHLADLASDAFRPKFKDYIEDLRALTGYVNSGWQDVVFWDSSLSSSDWKTESLSSPQRSNPAGGYSRVVQRSDWTTSAVLGDFTIGPGVDSSWNGKTQYDKGSLMVQRADTHLLVTPNAEAARTNSTPLWNYLWDNRYYIHGIYYVQRDGGSIIYPFGTGPGSDAPMRGVVTTSDPQRIDRYEDQTSYVYSRGIELEDGYWHYNGYYPIQGWSREVLYLRPKTFVVYDRTRKVNGGGNTYTQWMTWVVGKTPTTSSYSTGYRTEVSDGGTYKGGLTFLLPASMPSPSVSNLGSYGLLYHVKVSPPSETEYVNWLAVVDPADASANLSGVALFATRSNIDVMRVGTDKVVGFTSQQSGASASFPLTYTMSGMGSSVTHYVCGLAASTTYKRTVSGNDVTIDTSGGGTDTNSTAAGCVTFTSGAAGNPPVVVDTSDPMPSGTVGVAYSQCLAASGGDGGPYTFTKPTGSFPAGLSLTSGCISGTPTTAETANFTIQACDTVPDCSSNKSLSIVIAANSPTITTTTAPDGVNGSPYSAQVCASGGVPPYSYTKTSGDYCSGITLSDGSPCASLTGTPNAVQSCSFTLQVEDDLSQTDTQAFSMQVGGGLYTLSVETLPGTVSVVVRFGTAGLPRGINCVVSLLDGVATIRQTIVAINSSRQVVGFDGLAASSSYGATVDCPFSTSPGTISFTTNPSSGAQGDRTIPLVFGDSLLSAAERLTVEYDDNEAMSSPASIQNTSCGSGCTVNLTLPAGLYYYRHKWQTAADAVLATSSIQPLQVQ
jgi:hypothetical protein